ncbi:hypothetical protein [Streptomyces mirabilis]|uniref:hypothetical protein n=1 Tax=Streptomyces mirabilis TaxID=68239 RepID=UPI003324F40E
MPGPACRRRDRPADENLSITGSGARKTTILAPRTLVADADGGTSIVEIHYGASAALSQLAVRVERHGRRQHCQRQRLPGT